MMGARMAKVNSFHALFKATKADQSTEGELDISVPDRVRMGVSAFQGADEFGFETLIIGDKAYQRFAGFQGWFGGEFSDEDTGDGEISDFLEFFKSVYSDVSDLTLIGDREVVGDTPASHLQGTLSRDVLLLLDPSTEDNSSSVDLWIGAADPVLLRVALQFTPSGETADFTILDFDVPANIEPPASWVSIDVLTRFVEGGAVEPEELSVLISILPREAQSCVQAQLGQAIYDQLVAGSMPAGATEGSALLQCVALAFGAGAGQ